MLLILHGDLKCYNPKEYILFYIGYNIFYTYIFKIMFIYKIKCIYIFTIRMSILFGNVSEILCEQQEPTYDPVFHDFLFSVSSFFLCLDILVIFRMEVCLQLKQTSVSYRCVYRNSYFYIIFKMAA